MSVEAYNDAYWSQLYEKEAKKYYDVMKDKIKIILQLFDEQKGGRILDVGCGDGHITKIIGRKTGAEMHGIDIAAGPVKKAQKRGIKAKRVNLDGGKFPYKNNYFDAVFCGDVIEHLFETENLLENIYKVLKPNGILILSTPNVAAWYNRMFLLFGYMPVWIESSSRTYVGNPFMKECAGHVRAFTKRSLDEILRLKNFSVERIQGCSITGCGEYSQNQERAWNKIDRLFSKSATLSSTLIAKARKL